MSHQHDDHDHHQPRPASEVELRAQALEALLAERGLVSTDAVDAVVTLYEQDVGPQNGAKVVARAWVDDAYRERLLTNANAAIAELGFGGIEGDNMIVVANTAGVHNMIVCTLCSCYPWPVLGLPPTWYKSAPYRARVVKDPRGVLEDFGMHLPETVRIRVWDSTAGVRSLVLPHPPAGSEHLTERERADLVTRDSMIGTGLPLNPGGTSTPGPSP